jgi:hypothetical protein
MARQTIDVRVSSTASPERVYALLIDGSSWPTWSPIDSFELAQPGPDEAEGVGAIRIFHTKQGIGSVHSRERVVARIPGRRFSYVLESGMPLRDYRADVELSPSGAGTEIHWHSAFRGKVPGTGWFYRRVLGGFIERCARGLAQHAVTVAVPQ